MLGLGSPETLSDFRWEMKFAMKSCSRVVPVVLAVLAQSGCSSGEELGGDRGEWSLEEFLRIGSINESEAAFTDIAGISVTGGAIYVLEARPPQVLQFSRSGDWLRTFGRQGQGPGEFVSASSLGMSGATLWVADPRGGRLELFTPDGESLESVRFQTVPDSSAVRLIPQALIRGGGFLVGPGSISIGSVLSGSTDHSTYLRADSAGNTLNKIVDVPVSQSDFFQAQMGGGMIIGGHPLPESPLAAIYPDGSGLVVVDRWAATGPDSASLAVRGYDVDGTKSFEKQFVYHPVRVPEEWARRHFDEQMNQAGQSPPEEVQNEFFEAFQGGLSERDFFPPVTSVVTGVDGSIWIRREATFADSVKWEVLSRSGSWLGHLTTSARLAIRTATRDTIWGVITDDFDVPYVVGFKVVR